LQNNDRRARHAILRSYVHRVTYRRANEDENGEHRINEHCAIELSLLIKYCPHLNQMIIKVMMKDEKLQIFTNTTLLRNSPPMTIPVAKETS
jgi:hypothetical protein